MKKFFAIALVALTMMFAGCTRIATGEVGLRVNMSNETLPGELMPGSWNQTVFGNVLEFPVRDVPLAIIDAHPLTSDKTSLADFDLTAAYSINPSCVSDLWTKKSKTFHGYNGHEYLLMQQFVQNTLNSAAFKAVSQYPALEVSGKRDAIQGDIHKLVQAEMKETGYDNCLTINSIQVKSVVPDPQILASSKLVVTKANELAAKQAEKAIAEAETARLAALAAGGQSNQVIMQLENQRLLIQAIREGKVNTILLPTDFKGNFNVATK